MARRDNNCSAKRHMDVIVRIIGERRWQRIRQLLGGVHIRIPKQRMSTRERLLIELRKGITDNRTLSIIASCTKIYACSIKRQYNQGQLK